MSSKKKITEQMIKCDKCGVAMTPSEVRSYNEGIYGIDEHKDKRRWCFGCKEKEN